MIPTQRFIPEQLKSVMIIRILIAIPETKTTITASVNLEQKTLVLPSAESGLGKRSALAMIVQ